MAQRIGADFEILHRCSFHRGTGIEYGYPVCKFKGQVNVVGNKNDRFPLTGHLPEHLQSFQCLA